MSQAIKTLLIKGLFIMQFSAAAVAQDLTLINPPKLGDPTANGYSTAVVAPANARIAYISGQGGQDQTGALSPDFGTQVAQAYANLGVAIEGIGAKPEQVAKLTVYVVDHDMYKLGVLAQNVIALFGDKLPAQTLVPVPKLAIDTMLFEVEAIVVFR
ncbi:enamine deaminase RidA [Devosia sp. Leaf420]|uniref:RidA family protein n=1 Tax=Devosia sp. Leaf420 TaxID=1736374 RepID=UPI0007129DA8|nr:RidA family protein [Devosia sp. Leaf420]KQT44178.1 enamine deaminase RidA [Devosia sp. Leaf420]